MKNISMIQMNSLLNTLTDNIAEKVSNLPDDIRKPIIDKAVKILENKIRKKIIEELYDSMKYMIEDQILYREAEMQNPCLEEPLDKTYTHVNEDIKELCRDIGDYIHQNVIDVNTIESRNYYTNNSD